MAFEEKDYVTEDAMKKAIDLTKSALENKADLSMFTPMTQAEYDALENKDLPIYIVYEEE